MSDLRQYYQDRADAITTGDGKNTYITPQGVEVRNFFSPAIDLAKDVGAGIAEGAESLAAGLVLGAENINKAVDAILPGDPMQTIAKVSSDALQSVGVPEFRPEIGEGVGDQMIAGVAQALPGMIPAIRFLKGLGAVPGLVTEMAGGFIGDMLTTGKDDATGLIELIDMIPLEQMPAVTKAMTDFITSEDGTIDELNARLVGSVPGLVLGPAVEALGKLIVAAKKAGMPVVQDLIATMVERYKAGKSPVPMGMSIENVSERPMDNLLGPQLSGPGGDVVPGQSIDVTLENAWLDQTSGKIGVQGSANVLDDAPLSYKHKPVHQWSANDFEQVGNALGIERLGPASAPSEVSLMDGRTVNIPGGLDGKFTYYDMLTIKAQGIDASQLPEKFHAELQKKMSRSLMIEKLTDEQVWAGLAFGMTSPNNPLFPNQLAMSRLRGKGAIDELANSITWKFGDEVNPDVRADADRAIAAKFGLNAGEQGGLGVRGTQNYTRVAEMAQLFKENPEFFRRKRGEDWPDFAERVFSQVAGLRAKTGSFSVVFQDPLEAGVSAIDRHMARLFHDQILTTPAERLAWQKRTIDLFNARMKKAGNSRRAKTMNDIPDGMIGEMILSEVGKTASPKFRMADGSKNPNVPDRFYETDWIKEPAQIEMMGKQYKAALKQNQQEALKHGLGIFSSQWMLWDRMRRRLEPHENMFPGLERLPRMDMEQARLADKTHLETGHKDYTKEFVDEKGQVVQNPTDLEKEALTSRLRPTKPIDNPARLAYFAFPFGLMMMQGEEQ